MIVQLNSGIPIYNVLYNIGESKYKYVNTYFKDIIKKTTQGHDIKVALSELATKTKSHYLKKVLWGLIIGLTSGANIAVMIEKIHNMLVTKRIERINRYNGELQIISLLYLLFGAVLPSLGITLMFLFSIFKLIDITESLLMGFVIVSAIIQIILLGYIYVKRPKGL